MNPLVKRSWSLLPRGRRRGRNKIGTSSSADDISGEDTLMDMVNHGKLDGYDGEDEILVDYRDSDQHNREISLTRRHHNWLDVEADPTEIETDEDMVNFGKLDGYDGEDEILVEYRDSDQHNREFYPTRRHHNWLDVEADPTEIETDEDSLTDILGGPYLPPKQQEEGEQDPNVVHLTYVVPRRKQAVAPEDESTDKRKRSRNPFKRLSLKGPKSSKPSVGTSNRIPKFKPSKLFRQKKSTCNNDESPISSTTGSESTPRIVDDPPTSQILDDDADDVAKSTERSISIGSKQFSLQRTFGSRLDWLKMNSNKNMFHMRSGKSKEERKVMATISLDESSDASSISFYSFDDDSGSEVISFYDDNSYDDVGESIFSDLLHTLDDLANFRFLTDQYNCDTYGEGSKKRNEQKSSHRHTGRC